jgi:hypothetical protein
MSPFVYWRALILAILGLLWTVLEILSDHPRTLYHPAIRVTAYISFFIWVDATLFFFGTSENHSDFQIARLCFRNSWLLAIGIYVVHVIIAFHFGHHWQHQNAFQHVQASTGFGYGIFASYGFSFFWLGDGVILLIKPSTYFTRARWLQYAIHGIIAFFILNGTAIFGHGLMRWISAAIFAGLGLQWIIPFFSKKLRLGETFGE